MAYDVVLYLKFSWFNNNTRSYVLTITYSDTLIFADLFYFFSKFKALIVGIFL